MAYYNQSTEFFTVEHSGVKESLLKGFKKYKDITSQFNKNHELESKIKEESKRDYKSIINGLIYGILYEPLNTGIYFRHLVNINSDNYELFLTNLVKFIDDCHMELVPSNFDQIYIIFEKLSVSMVKNDILINLLIITARCFYPGLTLLSDPMYLLNFCKFIQKFTPWIIEHTTIHENICGRIFVKILRLFIEFHFYSKNNSIYANDKKEKFNQIKDIQLKILTDIYKSRKQNIFDIGKELIRLIIQVANTDYDIIKKILRDLFKDNEYFKILNIPVIDGYDRYVQMGIPPLMERMVIFILIRVKSSSGQCGNYLKWIMKKFEIETIEGQTIIPDITRFVITNYNFYSNNNKNIISNPTPRYELLGNFVITYKDNVISMLLKQAIFMDMITFDKERDDVKLVEPGMQLIFFSGKNKEISLELIEYVYKYSELFDQKNKESYRNSIYEAMKKVEETNIVKELNTLFDNLFQDGANDKIKKMYIELIKFNNNSNHTQNNENQAFGVPHRMLRTGIERNSNPMQGNNIMVMNNNNCSNNNNLRFDNNSSGNSNIVSHNNQSAFSYSTSFIPIKNENSSFVNPKIKTTVCIIKNDDESAMSSPVLSNYSENSSMNQSEMSDNNNVNYNIASPAVNQLNTSNTNGKMKMVMKGNNNNISSVSQEIELQSESYMPKVLSSLISETSFHNFTVSKSKETFSKILDDLCKSYNKKRKGKSESQNKLLSSIEQPYIELLTEFAKFYLNSFKDELLLSNIQSLIIKPLPNQKSEIKLILYLYDYMYHKQLTTEFQFLVDLLNKLIDIYPKTIVLLFIYLSIRSNNSIGKALNNSSFLYKLFDSDIEKIRDKIHLFFQICLDELEPEILNYVLCNCFLSFHSAFCDNEILILDIIISSNIQTINTISNYLLYGKCTLFGSNLYKIIQSSFDLTSSVQTKLWSLINAQKHNLKTTHKEFIEKFVTFANQIYISKDKIEQEEFFMHFTITLKKLIDNYIIQEQDKTKSNTNIFSLYLDLCLMFEFHCDFRENIYESMKVLLERIGKNMPKCFYLIVMEYIKERKCIYNEDKTTININKLQNLYSIISFISKREQEEMQKGFNINNNFNDTYLTDKNQYSHVKLINILKDIIDKYELNDYINISY